jgi:hypothetical protein
MAIRFINTDITTSTSSTPGVSLLSGDTLFIGPEAEIAATGLSSDGIRAAGSAEITIQGTIFGAAAGVAGAGTLPVELTVAENGFVLGGSRGVLLLGDGNTVTNAGEIAGDVEGIRLETGSSSNTISNSGHITGTTAIFVADGFNEIANTGQIIGTGGTGTGIDLGKGGTSSPTTG